MAMTEKVAKNIAILLKLLNMKQQSLADESGVSMSSIQRIINGRVAPDIATIESIAKAMNVPIDVMFSNNLEQRRLTGISTIDTAITEINNHLYDGPNALKRIGHYFADDYALHYAHQATDGITRPACDLTLEFAKNTEDQTNVKRISMVLGAYIVDDLVCIDLEVRRNATYNDHTIAADLHNEHLWHVAHLIDHWSLVYPVADIVAGKKPVKIKKRTLKYLHEEMM